jgi:hypothetical protein
MAMEYLKAWRAEGPRPLESHLLPAAAPASASGLHLNLAFSLAASIVYLAILTNGTFSFGGPESLDQAYGALARSLLSGHLDVTRAVIGNEGFYVDGKVYLYYGILPALLRIPFLLAGAGWIPEPRFFVFAEAALTALLFHLTIFSVLTARAGALEKSTLRATVVFSGAIGWFASPAYLLTSNASIYNEPFGCALLLLAAVVYLLREQILAALSGAFPVVSAGRLAGIALLAALALHARPPMAVSLFVVVGVLCLLTALEPAAGRTLVRRIGHFARKSALPGLLLASSIAAFLWLNWARFGNPFSSGPITHYGYYLFVEGLSDRMEAFIAEGRFDVRRVIPNLIVNFLGFPWGHSALSGFLGAGSIRLEGPLMGVLILWLIPSIYAAFGISLLAKTLRGTPRAGLWLVALAAAMSLSTLIILSYATVTLRYKSEIWPLIFVLAIFGFYGQTSAYSSRYLLDTRGWGHGLPLAKVPVWIMLAISIAAGSAAVFVLKSDPFFNGDPYSVFLDFLHPELPGAAAD